MVNNYLLRFLAVLSLHLLAYIPINAQVTTATVNGLITSTSDEPLIGATVVMVHIPSGTQYGTVTREDGRYSLPNVRVGGPYSLTISYVGYENQKNEGLFLSLGQKLNFNANLKEASSQLNEVVIKANNNDILNGERTGAATNVSNEQIRNLPTISRSASDYTRLTPSSDGNSFGGRNDQFNNFSLDGTIFNNPFGLDAATPGGQTDAQPISLDAIDQIQVSLAPYDVTQAGFTGAAVNAVTKSGTNNFTGTVFGFYRNQNMTGSKIGGAKVFRPDLNQFQTGFSLGGPLIKNKLFFFINSELERRSDLGSSFVAARSGLTGGNVSRVLASDLDAVSSILKSKFGYDTGVYENFTHKTNNQKGIAKLDWNIAQNHHLTLTYNFLDAFKEKPAHPSAIGRRGPDYTTLQFYNSGYRVNNKIQSGIAELKSLFNNRISNKLQIGISKFTDSRDPFSTPFPVININKDGSRYIVAGHEPFSIYNRLNQRVFQINDNLTFYTGKHTFTLGASLERFSFDNAFNLNAYEGTFGTGYASTQSFLDDVNKGALDKIVKDARDKFANTPEDGWNWYSLNVGQIAAYAQDEIQVNSRLSLTVGLRIDKPAYFNTKELIEEKLSKSCCYQPENTYYDENGKATKFDHTVLPSTKPLFSPRIGFNWDVNGDRTTQLRGGSGLFTGRLPFVWIGNHVGNPDFFFYCITHPDFKFPQVWRSNLGYDQKIGEGWIFSADIILTKDLNAMMVRNYGLNLPKGTLQGPGARPIYLNADRAKHAFGDVTNAYVFTNTNVGNSTNISLQIQRNWTNGLFSMLGYNYGLAKDASSIEAEISSDAYDRNPAYGNVNQAVLAPSVYGNLHRVVGVLSKKFAYSNGKMATTVSTFFQYAKGGRFSYTYSGDINNDGSGNNDLIYIPTDSEIGQMKFTGTEAQQTAQRSALQSFIAQDKYMSGKRGQVVEKYGILSPWYNSWDVRVLQDFSIGVGNGKTNTIQVSLDILNFGNLISSKWGVRQLPSNTQFLGVSVANNVPTYSFDTTLKNTFVNDFSLLSRWQAQLGLRYIF